MYKRQYIVLSCATVSRRDFAGLPWGATNLRVCMHHQPSESSDSATPGPRIQPPHGPPRGKKTLERQHLPHNHYYRVCMPFSTTTLGEPCRAGRRAVECLVVLLALLHMLWLRWPCAAPPPPLLGVLRPIPFGAGVICDSFTWKGVRSMNQSYFFFPGSG